MTDTLHRGGFGRRTPVCLAMVILLAGAANAEDTVFGVERGRVLPVAAAEPVSLTGTGGVLKTGFGSLLWGYAGLLTADYAGDTEIREGTVVLHPQEPMTDRWLRFTFKSCTTHRFYGDVAWTTLRFGEIKFYDAERQPLVFALLACSGSTEQDLQPGEFLQRLPSGVSLQGDCANLFDGKDDTAWLATGQKKTLDDPANWIVITVRLPDDAAYPITYNFLSADSRYFQWHGTPEDFAVESSADGIAWRLVSEHAGACPETAGVASTPYFPESVALNPTTAYAALPCGVGRGVVEVAPSGALDLNGAELTVNALKGGVENSSAERAWLTVGADGSSSTVGWGANRGNIGLAKIGEGTVSVDAYDARPTAMEVDDGTLKAERRTVAYRHYRLKFEAVMGVAAAGVRLAEIALLKDGADVTRAGSVTLSCSSVRILGIQGSLANLVDRQLWTEFYDPNLSASDGQSDDFCRRRCWVQLDYDEPVAVDSYNWGMGQSYWDASSADCQNPAAWCFQGSDDGVTWHDLDRVRGFARTQLKSWMGPFPIAAATEVPADLSATPISLYGGTFELATSAIMPTYARSGGSLLLDVGVEAIWSVAADQSAVLGGGLTGSGTVVKEGPGALLLSGDNGSLGGVCVRAGELKVRPGRAEKWVRIAFQRASAHRFHGDQCAWASLRFSEIELFDANGNRVNKGLRLTRGTVADELQPGEYLQSVPSGSNPGSANGWCLFDDNIYTGWILTGWTTDGTDPSRWVSLAMRLADEAAPVASYNFKAIWNGLEWSGLPDDFLVEVSADGRAWSVVDSQKQAYTDFAFAAGGPFFPTAQRLEAPPAIPEQTPLCVLPGASLDIEQPIGSLVVQDGVFGSITRFDPTPSGTVDLVGTDLSLPCVLKDAFGCATNLPNARTWRVRVNGETRTDLRFRVSDDGTAEVREAAGLAVVVK